MNLETLKEIKPTRVTHGKPVSTLTDKEWQEQFNFMKLYIEPYKKATRLGGKYSRESGMKVKNYDGITNWQIYCAFINDVLKQIRAGKHEYCYFGYQIIDLLKFHLNDLRTKYCDGYWEVWLESKML